MLWIAAVLLCSGDSGLLCSSCRYLLCPGRSGLLCTSGDVLCTVSSLLWFKLRLRVELLLRSQSRLPYSSLLWSFQPLLPASELLCSGCSGLLCSDR